VHRVTGWETPSPFIFDGPVPPAKLIGRQFECDTLRSWVRAGRFTALVAPRRFGKTSLIGKLADETERKDKIPTIVVDLYDVASIADLVIRLERAWSAHAPHRLRSKIAEVLAGAQVGLNVAGSGFTMRLAERPDTDPLPALHTLLDLPAKVAAKNNRVLIVLDEFQSLASLSRAEAIIRSHAQHQRKTASYLFCGSEPGMVAAAFEDRARPFYGQVQTFTLGRLDPVALTRFVADGFALSKRDISEVLPDLVAASEGHPQRSMLLAHLLFQQVTPRSSATMESLRAALDAALDRVDPEARSVLGGLDFGSRKTLRAIAEYGTPISARAGRTLDLPKTTAADAAARLQKLGIVEREPTSRRWRLVDPLLARWLRERYATRSI
jgi:hypothetical protein